MKINFRARSLFSASAFPVAKHSKPVFDFRSDTVSRPTPDMLRHMLEHGSLDDDVFEEDSSTRQLEAEVAKLCGKESALFCVSGTMSNQLALCSQLRPFESILLSSQAHIFCYENFGASFLSRAGMVPVWKGNVTGLLTFEDVQEHATVETDIHTGRTGLICLENTLNGNVHEQSDIEAISKWAKTRDIRLHCDGARLWNASVSSSLSIQKLCESFDSISVCLSKGLGAPMGSVLVGNDETVRKARHYRKLIGGGWRKSGLMAEAGLYALNKNFIGRDQEGNCAFHHQHAVTKYLARQITSRFSQLKVCNQVQTNMIYLDVSELISDVVKFAQLVEQAVPKEADYSLKLPRYGYKTIGTKSKELIRLVIHNQIGMDGANALLESIQSATATV